MNIFHLIHKWKPVSTKYPIRVFWNRGIEDGTAIQWKCKCGKKKVTERIMRWSLWKGTLIHTIGGQDD